MKSEIITVFEAEQCKNCGEPRPFMVEGELISARKRKILTENQIRHVNIEKVSFYNPEQDVRTYSVGTELVDLFFCYDICNKCHEKQVVKVDKRITCIAVDARRNLHLPPHMN